MDVGADRFDPVRFQLIKSMASRASQQRSAVRLLVQQKIETQLEHYHRDLETLKADASLAVARIESQHPDSADIATRCLTDYKFREILKFESKLEQNSGKQQGAATLAALTALLDAEDGLRHYDDLDASNPRHQNLDDLLLQQEGEVFNLFAARSQPIEPNADGLKRKELKSAKSFRATLSKRNAHKLVTQIIDDAPENPGPLNPQTLVTRSLSSMRDLSPAYLNRFVSYANTLLWLDQAAKSIEPVKGKKKRAETTKT